LDLYVGPVIDAKLTSKDRHVTYKLMFDEDIQWNYSKSWHKWHKFYNC